MSKPSNAERNWGNPLVLVGVVFSVATMVVVFGRQCGWA